MKISRKIIFFEPFPEQLFANCDDSFPKNFFFKCIGAEYNNVYERSWIRYIFSINLIRFELSNNVCIRVLYISVSYYIINSRNWWDFPLYFHLYVTIGQFLHIPKFWRKTIFFCILKAKYQNVLYIP